MVGIISMVGFKVEIGNGIIVFYRDLVIKVFFYYINLNIVFFEVYIRINFIF